MVTSSRPLEQGQRYLRVATGTYQVSAVSLGDAEYIFVDASPQDGEFLPGFFDSGLSINHPVTGNKVTRWGSYDDSHRYEVMFDGVGESLTVQIMDKDLDNNGGELRFEIYR